MCVIVGGRYPTQVHQYPCILLPLSMVAVATVSRPVHSGRRGVSLENSQITYWELV